MPYVLSFEYSVFYAGVGVYDFPAEVNVLKQGNAKIGYIYQTRTIVTRRVKVAL